MNTDDFERRLRQQELRQIPSNWREEILGKANEGAGEFTPDRARVLIDGILVAWRELIVRCRYAWSGMVVLWFGLFWVNAHIQPGAARGIQPSTRLVAERIRVFKEQRRVLVELTGPMQSAPVEPSGGNSPKRRSEGVRQARSC